MKRTREPKPRFRVGDWVSVLGAVGPKLAQVIEDRGPIGFRGRRLYTIRLEISPEAVLTPEVPEDEMEPAAPPEKSDGARK